MLSMDLSENWDDVIIFVCGGVYELSRLVQLPDGVKACFDAATHSAVCKSWRLSRCAHTAALPMLNL